MKKAVKKAQRKGRTAKKKKAAVPLKKSTNQQGYTIIAKESKPSFSKAMVHKMMAASR